MTFGLKGMLGAGIIGVGAPMNIHDDLVNTEKADIKTEEIKKE